MEKYMSNPSKKKCSCKIDLTVLPHLRFGFNNFRKELLKQSPDLRVVTINISFKAVRATVESTLGDYPCGTYLLMVSMRGRLVIVTTDTSLLRDLRAAKKFAR